MQHFWVTKKTVQRKLGTKEDEYIISSDAELDAKIEIFKSIAETSSELSKIIEQYQERLCILSQEESLFGRFLKEAGKRSKTTSQSITNTGKSVSYCGQQRMCIRVPLLRLQHEVDIFRNRAIIDTQSTISNMEKERTEYRAALEWMKSASAELDPDTGRGVDKFRTAQAHVRAAKQNFDTLSMDSIQKIDLLAAARCNMFSHVLVSYITELKQFGLKSSATYDTISKALEQKPKYDFCILKELTQYEEVSDHIKDISSFDNDQTLFFASDYADLNTEESIPKKLDIQKGTNANEQNHTPLIELSNDRLLDLCGIENNFSSQLCDDNKATDQKQINSLGQNARSSKISMAHKLKKKQVDTKTNISVSDNLNSTKSAKQKTWIELFADLDPLCNLEVFDLKINGNLKSSQQT
uniref:AH domain-containing protein n=1 Tax=Musca domestica TaxID=7370 RepID=A0A1I8N3H6_MUSDO